MNRILTGLLLMYHFNVAGGLDQSDEQLATTKSSNLYVGLKLYIKGSDWGSAGREKQKYTSFNINNRIFFKYICEGFVYTSNIFIAYGTEEDYFLFLFQY